jgi:hypothetical protein
MSMDKQIILICKSVWYYSRLDEDIFFEWISRIKCILKFDGIRDELYLYIKNKRLNNENLRDLLALFYRYKIDMKQLKIFLNKNNKEWFFDNKKAYWHRRVFGNENL